LEIKNKKPLRSLRLCEKLKQKQCCQADLLVGEKKEGARKIYSSIIFPCTLGSSPPPS
jgi:hypothetical protein